MAAAMRELKSSPALNAFDLELFCPPSVSIITSNTTSGQH